MPTARIIANRSLNNLVSPIKLQPPSLTAVELLDANQCRVGGREVSNQCPSSPFGISSEETNPDAEGCSMAPFADHQDVFDQWNALVQRETSSAYAIQELHTASEKVRYHACLWCYEIVDEYDIDRSTVSIALSYFDRLVSSGFVAREDWTVAFVTSLYLAVKINSYQGRLFFPEDMAKISGRVTKDQILDMENHICQVFDWHLNPPVPVSFLDIITPLLKDEPMCDFDFNQLVDIDIQDEGRDQLISQSIFLCERSVMDTFFTDKNPSSVAYASLLVAMDLLQFPRESSEWFVSLPFDHDTEETELCVQRLQLICSEEEYQPSVTYESFVDPQTSDADDGEEIRVVTPTKDLAHSSIKRMHQDTVVRFSYEGVSPKKRRSSVLS